LEFTTAAHGYTHGLFVLPVPMKRTEYLNIQFYLHEGDKYNV
jgi:hypothetical protein